MTVTLVDDDSDDSETFREALYEVDASIRCLTYLDPAKFLDDVFQQVIEPDIIFLDLNMPRISGTECLSALKNRPYISSVPVVIFTTSDSEIDKRESVARGASGFISKPDSFTEIKNMLRQTLSHLL